MGGGGAEIQGLLWKWSTEVPQVLNNRDDVFRHPGEASLLLGNIFKQPHPSRVDLAKNRVEGTIT